MKAIRRGWPDKDFLKDCREKRRGKWGWLRGSGWCWGREWRWGIWVQGMEQRYGGDKCLTDRCNEYCMSSCLRTCQTLAGFLPNLFL
jgi:hypothetical protein